jgi:hypothetical protein
MDDAVFTIAEHTGNRDLRPLNMETTTFGYTCRATIFRISGSMVEALVTLVQEQ